MPVLLVFASAGAWLLLGAGLMKLRRPEGTGNAIRVLTGIGETRVGARLLGAGEVGVSLGFIIWPGRVTASGIGAAYLAVFATAWLLRSRDADCGCFGEASSEVGNAHVAVTLVAAISAFGLTLVGNTAPAPETYILVLAALPISLGAYAVVAPLAQLKSRLADLRT